MTLYRIWLLGILREKKIIITNQETGEEKEYHESVKLYSVSDIEHMLSKSGLTVTNLFGSFKGEPWSQQSPRSIFLAEKQS